MGKRVCIVCGEEKAGYKVEDDILLRAIRSAKERLGNATGNELVVCEADVPKAKEKRARFEKTAMAYAALGACVLLITLFTGKLPMSAVFGFIGLVAVLSLALVSYYPRAALPNAQPAKESRPAAPGREGEAAAETGG